MVYTIREGKHYSLHLPRLHFGRETLNFQFKLDQSCNYWIDGEDKYDINKIYGISWGHHHENSFRLGYVCISNNRFQLYSYSYNHGELQYKKLLNFNAYETVKVNINFLYDQQKIRGYVIGEEDTVDIIEPFLFPKFKWGYYLYPYFGGNQVAQKRTRIQIINK